MSNQSQPKRICFNCQSDLPPETEHFVIQDEAYCTDCVEAKPYTAYTYYIDGEYAGNSDDGESHHIEAYADEYEEVSHDPT